MSTTTQQTYRILIVGQGGREHAMALALSRANRKRDHGRVELICAPGNPGTAMLAEHSATPSHDIGGLVQVALAHQADFVVCGPEAPLADGLSDALRRHGIPCVGPDRYCAQLEASKSFARKMASDLNIPSPKYRLVTQLDELDEALAAFSEPPVVKADGLAAGKGVVVAESFEQSKEAAIAMLNGQFGQASQSLVLEERMTGREASLFFACVGQKAIGLPHAQDHKRLLDGAKGPNTGGMGAISPNPHLDTDFVQRVQHAFVDPILEEFHNRGFPYRGFLFVGLMLTDEGPKLLEYNVRLGDPETQVILPILADGDFFDICQGIAQDQLPAQVHTANNAACAIVLTSEGYPYQSAPDRMIEIGDGLQTASRWMIHAGTGWDHGKLVATGGRVAAIVATGETQQDAQSHAYEGLEHIRFEGMHFRRDIGGITT